MKNMIDEDAELLRYLRALCYWEASITKAEYDKNCSLLREYQTVLLDMRIKF